LTEKNSAAYLGHVSAAGATRSTRGDGTPQPLTELGSGGINNSEISFPLQVIEPQYMDRHRCHLQYVDGISFAELARCPSISGHLELFGVRINETAVHRMGILVDVNHALQGR
jgi:hypothetical protein